MWVRGGGRKVGQDIRGGEGGWLIESLEGGVGGYFGGGAQGQRIGREERWVQVCAG